MIKRFLKAKHWQLFLLIIVIPIVFQIISMLGLFLNLDFQNPDPHFMLNYMQIFPLQMIFLMAVLFGWQWSMAVGLQQYIPEEIRLKTVLFKLFLFFPIGYFFLFIGFFSFSISNLDTAPNFLAFAFIMPLHLFAMFCMLYNMYFIAKTFKTAELQRKVSFSDFAGEFFLIWFYFIGIWIVQPKVNKIIERAETNTDNQTH